MDIKEVNEVILDQAKHGDIKIGLISDGYHTFDELYEHRIALYMAFCSLVSENKTAPVWKTKVHSDGSVWDGWFILGVDDVPGRQITYHLPMSKWDKCNYIELTKAPVFDGHTSNDVLERLGRW